MLYASDFGRMQNRKKYWKPSEIIKSVEFQRVAFCTMKPLSRLRLYRSYIKYLTNKTKQICSALIVCVCVCPLDVFEYLV